MLKDKIPASKKEEKERETHKPVTATKPKRKRPESNSRASEQFTEHGSRTEATSTFTYPIQPTKMMKSVAMRKTVAMKASVNQTPKVGIASDALIMYTHVCVWWMCGRRKEEKGGHRKRDRERERVCVFMCLCETPPSSYFYS